MSSMFRKKGGMAFKPKMPMARPRAPGAASSAATEPKTQPTEDAASDDISSQDTIQSTAATPTHARTTTDAPPLPSSNVTPASTPQPQQPSEPVAASKPLSHGRETSRDAPSQSASTPSSQPTTIRTPALPTTNAPQPESTTALNLDVQANESSTPTQLQTPPATAPSAADTTSSGGTPADSIEPAEANASTPPAKRARKRAPQAEGDGGEGEGGAAAPKPKRQRKKKDAAATEEGGEAAPKRPPRPRRRKTTEDGVEGGDGENDESVASRASRPPRRVRSMTPEDAETQEADLSVLTMGDLTRDLRIGKKFSRHDELLQRHRDKQMKAREKLKNRSNGSEDAASEGGTPAPPSGSGTPAPAQVQPEQPTIDSTGPRFQIINGQIVVDENSLTIDRHAIAAANAGDMLEIEENDFTNLSTQNSYRTGSKLKGPNVWTEEETELFYRGLRMFGTDFQMISGMFPGKNRRHVKMKFNREERHAPARVDAILVGKKELQIDLEEYKTWTKAEYEPVEAIMAEQRAQQAEFDAEQAKAKAEKDAVNAKKRAALMGDGNEAPGTDDVSAGGTQSRPRANIGPQITVDADGLITIDETDVDPDAGRRKRGAGKGKKKAVEYNMRGEIIR